MGNNSTEYRRGVISAVGCMLLWGVLPAYWKALVPIDSWVIIIYRILLVFVSSLALACRSRSVRDIFRPLRDRKIAWTYFAAGMVITINWSAFIWAVNAGHIIDTSIGYYIEPLAICLFGIFLFKEKVTKYKAAALGCSALSVIVLLIHFHRLPWISLGLALTFSVYSAIKKSVHEPPLVSLVLETVFLAPAALVLIIVLEASGRGALSVAGSGQMVLLALAGFATAVPLALFTAAAQKIPLFALGLIQYISPTISLSLGALIYHEPFDRMQFVAVAIIWLGLCIFSYGEYRESKEGDGAGSGA